MIIKVAAILFGIFQLTAGILGFQPEITPGNYLLGIFLVNRAQNYFRIFMGVLALLSGFTDTKMAKNYFAASGILYALLSICGYSIQEGLLFGIFATNPADNWLYVALALYALIFGLLVRDKHAE